MTVETRPSVAWPVIAVGVIALAVGLVVRWLLLPAEGLVGDMNVFVQWTHGIALERRSANAYDQNLSFGPVMAFVWGIIAAIDPVFRTATDASDLGVQILPEAARHARGLRARGRRPGTRFGPGPGGRRPARP